MKDAKRRLDRLEAATVDGGQHTMTICYLNDWREPPTEPVTRVVPGLKEDVIIQVLYVERWKDNEPI
jgi:hypothetical protein